MKLEVGFSGAKSMPVTDVTPEQIIVLEDGVERPIVSLQKADGAASICILIDQSSSMGDGRKALLEAAKTLIAGGNSTTEFAIVAFDVRTYLEQDFTNDASKLEGALKQIRFGGGSGLIDAVWISIDHVMAHATKRRKIIVILSDGSDNYSRVYLKDLIKKAGMPGAPLIYWLAPRSFGAATHGFSEVALVTGGFSDGPEQGGDLEAEAVRLSQILNSDVSVEYTSTHAQRDGRLHKVVIKMRPGMASAHTKYRREYYAPSN